MQVGIVWVVPDRALPARAVLDAVTLVGLSTAVLEAAGGVDRAEVRSLDALHLAAALDLGDDLVADTLRRGVPIDTTFTLDGADHPTERGNEQTIR